MLTARRCWVIARGTGMTVLEDAPKTKALYDFTESAVVVVGRKPVCEIDSARAEVCIYISQGLDRIRE